LGELTVQWTGDDSVTDIAAAIAVDEYGDEEPTTDEPEGSDEGLEPVGESDDDPAPDEADSRGAVDG